MLGRARGFGAPLWWMDPSPEAVRRIVLDARRAVPRTSGHGSSDNIVMLQPWLRKVFAETCQRLAAAHIFVEE